MSRAWRFILAAGGVLFLSLALWWGFREYGGPEAATFLSSAPFPCPLHPWR
jgi:hypothetical protein